MLLWKSGLHLHDSEGVPSCRAVDISLRVSPFIFEVCHGDPHNIYMPAQTKAIELTHTSQSPSARGFPLEETGLFIDVSMFSEMELILINLLPQ